MAAPNSINKVTLYIIIFASAVNILHSDSWIRRVNFVNNLQLDNLKCLRVNDALSDENNVHLIVCQGCDLIHIKLTRTDSEWKKTWKEHLTNVSRTCADEKKHIQDAIFLPAGRNACKVLYLDGAQPNITELKYRVSTMDQQVPRITQRRISVLLNRVPFSYTGLHNYNIQHYYSTVLIADKSTPSINSLNTVNKQITSLNASPSYKPYYFSDDPLNSTNVFVITDAGLKKLVFNGNRYQHDEDLTDGGFCAGTKVLALTSTKFLILSNETEGVVSLKLNSHTKPSGVERRVHLKNNSFTSLGLHKLSKTVFLTTRNRIYYNFTSNTTQPTAPLTTPTTTRLTTTSQTTQKPIQVKATPMQTVVTPQVRTQNPKTLSSTTLRVDPQHPNMIIVICTVALGSLLCAIGALLLCFCRRKMKRRKSRIIVENPLRWSLNQPVQRVYHEYDSIGNERLSDTESDAGYQDVYRGAREIPQLSNNHKAKDALFENKVNAARERQNMLQVYPTRRSLQLDQNDIF